MLKSIALIAALALASAAQADSVPGFSALPSGAIQRTATASVSAATATATLSGMVGHDTFLAAFQITGGGATGESNIVCTVAGVEGGTIDFAVQVPAGATAGITPIEIAFTPPLVSAAEDTDIVVSCPTFGSGNTTAVVTAEGYVV